MFIMAVPLKETEASLERLVDVSNSKGRLRAGLSINGVFSNESNMESSALGSQHCLFS